MSSFLMEHVSNLFRTKLHIIDFIIRFFTFLFKIFHALIIFIIEGFLTINLLLISSRHLDHLCLS